MNKSVSSYVPKDRAFSRTQSLNIGLSLTGAAQVAGYQQLCTRIYNIQELPVDANLTSFLKMMDTTKAQKKERPRSKKGKAGRSKGRY